MTSLLPVSPLPTKKARIHSLDAIRGVAILGVLAVNADGFAMPISAALKPENWPFGHQGVTAFLYWMMDAFFHDKFLALFSMLFGVSLFLVGGDITDKRRNIILARRLAALLAFAMLHGFGIWWGDILSTYALTGVIMFFCRSLPAKTLLVIGSALVVGAALRHLSVEWHAFFPGNAEPMDHAVSQAAALHATHQRIDADVAQATGSWSGAYAVNTRSYVHQLLGMWTVVASTLGLMMVGLSLFKSGFLAGRSSPRRCLWTLAAGLASLAIVGTINWMTDVSGEKVFAGAFLVSVLSPIVALGYAAGIVLVLRGRFAAILSPFSAAGRMAFTNYLTQSILMTSIFYGGRGALMGKVDRPGLWAIVIAIWLLQLAWSTLWLRRFEMGPFEWIWRCLTYGRRSAFIKPRSDE